MTKRWFEWYDQVIPSNFNALGTTKNFSIDRVVRRRGFDSPDF